MPLKSITNSHGNPTVPGHPQSATVDPASSPLLGNEWKQETRDFETVLEACLVLCVPEWREEDGPRDLLQQCLATVLPISNGESPNGSQLRSHLNEYTIAPEQRDRYKPFVLGFNRALADLKAVECDPLRPPSDLDIMFHRNDIMTKDGTSSHPDVILAALKTVQAGSRTESRWDHLAHIVAGDPPECHFDSQDILSGQEFELRATEGSTLQDRYEVDSPVWEDPRPILSSVEGPDADETDMTEALEESRRRASAQNSARDSGRPRALSPWKSTRLASNSTMEQQPHALSSSMGEAEGGDLGKRKRRVYPRVGAIKRLREATQVPNIPAMLWNAAERMSRAFWVTHVIDLVIVDDVAYVWYRDNEYSVQSLGINIIHDLPHFLVLLLAFQRFTSRDWGVMEEFRTVKPTTSPDEEISLCVGASPDLPALQFNLLLNEDYRLRDGPGELRTEMLATTSSSRDPRDITKTLEGVDMVSKLYWSRESQVPKVFISGEGNEGVGGHLPDPIYTRDFEQHSTMHIRSLLGIGAESSRRVLRLAVFHRLYPITDLVGMEFWRVFWECFHHHLDQWLDGMRDHDISISDLKYDMVANRGIFDPHPSGTEQTGTMPFMALDLLLRATCDYNVTREYRHEVESFAWILLWICCTYEDGKELCKRPLQRFIQQDPYATYEQKLALHIKKGVNPTTSYNKEFIHVALVIIATYRTRHCIASWNPKASEDVGKPGNPESSHTEREAIEAELQLCQEGVAFAGLSVDCLTHSF